MFSVFVVNFPYKITYYLASNRSFSTNHDSKLHLQHFLLLLLLCCIKSIILSETNWILIDCDDLHNVEPLPVFCRHRHRLHCRHIFFHIAHQPCPLDEIVRVWMKERETQRKSKIYAALYDAILKRLYANQCKLAFSNGF